MQRRGVCGRWGVVWGRLARLVLVRLGFRVGVGCWGWGVRAGGGPLSLSHGFRPVDVFASSMLKGDIIGDRAQCALGQPLATAHHG